MCVAVDASPRSTHATVQQLLIGTESAQNVWVAQFRGIMRDTMSYVLVVPSKDMVDPSALLHVVDAGPAALHGVGSGTAATHTRSLLQGWFGSGAQAQAQAQSQSFGGFAQSQSQAQGEDTACMPECTVAIPSEHPLRAQQIGSSRH